MSTADEHARRYEEAVLDTAHDRDLSMPEATSRRYPDYLMPFVGSQEERDQRFADSLEALLLNYGYNTARAYRADLEDIYLWADGRGYDIFALTAQQLKQYCALLRRRKYSESTIRRRSTAWNVLVAHFSCR